MIYSFSDKAEVNAKYSQLYAVWESQLGQSVTTLVNEYNRKKNAYEYQFRKQVKSGSLDFDRIAEYKISDDLFMNITHLPKGKGHGVIMVIDLSGSMNHRLFDLIRQITVVFKFCHRVNLPVKLMGFSSYQGHRDDVYLDKSSSCFTNHTLFPIIDNNLTKSEQNYILFLLWLNNIKNSKLSSHTIYMTASRSQNTLVGGQLMDFVLKKEIVDFSVKITPSGGTPFHQAIVNMIPHVHAFRAETRVQNVSVMFFTDGENTETLRYTGRSFALTEDMKNEIFDQCTNKVWYIDDFLTDDHRYFFGTGKIVSICARMLAKMTSCKVGVMVLGHNVREAINHLALSIREPAYDNLKAIIKLQSSALVTIPNFAGFDRTIFVNAEAFSAKKKKMEIPSGKKNTPKNIAKALSETMTSNRYENMMAKEIADMITEDFSPNKTKKNPWYDSKRTYDLLTPEQKESILREREEEAAEEELVFDEGDVSDEYDDDSSF